MQELVFIHGSGDSARIWHDQITYLRQLPSVRAEALDLPGHGSRPDTLPQDASVSDYTEAAYSAIRNELQMEWPIIAGHSLGGVIALMMALSYGSQLAGLILIGTGARLRVLPDLLEETRLSPMQAKQRLIEMAVLPTHKETIAQPLLHDALPQNVSQLYRDLHACDQFDIRERLYEIQLPTLIICGAEDRLTPPRYSEYLQQKIAGSELHIVEEAGHYVMREQAEAVNERIGAWLQHTSE